MKLILFKSVILLVFIFGHSSSIASPPQTPSLKYQTVDEEYLSALIHRFGLVQFSRMVSTFMELIPNTNNPQHRIDNQRFIRTYVKFLATAEGQSFLKEIPLPEYLDLTMKSLQALFSALEPVEQNFYFSGWSTNNLMALASAKEFNLTLTRKFIFLAGFFLAKLDDVAGEEALVSQLDLSLKLFSQNIRELAGLNSIEVVYFFLDKVLSAFEKSEYASTASEATALKNVLALTEKLPLLEEAPPSCRALLN